MRARACVRACVRVRVQCAGVYAHAHEQTTWARFRKRVQVSANAGQVCAPVNALGRNDSRLLQFSVPVCALEREWVGAQH